MASDSILRLVESAKAALTAYANSFDQASTASLKSEALYSGEMRPLTEHLSESSSEVQQSISKDFAATQKELAADIDFATMLAKISATVALLLGAGIAFVVGRGIINPISSMTDAMQTLSNGKTDVGIPSLTSRDEMGSMARAVEIFRTNAIEVERLRQQQKLSEQQAAAERQADM